VRFSGEKLANPMTMNKARTASLMITMTAFAVADSRVPRTSSREHSATRTMAGMLK
jgi:hypothetical protein